MFADETQQSTALGALRSEELIAVKFKRWMCFKGTIGTKTELNTGAN